MVCAAVSGGADSVALLTFLLSLQEPMQLTITACHLNHCLRGAEADRDERFVRELCRCCGVPLTVERDPGGRTGPAGASLGGDGRPQGAGMPSSSGLHRETGCR